MVPTGDVSKLLSTSLTEYMFHVYTCMTN